MPSAGCTAPRTARPDASVIRRDRAYPDRPALRDDGGMTVVFVHGVPETSALWNGVRAHLDGDALAVGLPGFGTPRPAGFGATKDEYAQWLAGELRRLGGPVDLVGHDWG